MYPDGRVTNEVTADGITLKCSSAKPSDMGRYTLNISNEMGSDSVQMNVVVVGMYLNHISILFSIFNLFI